MAKEGLTSMGNWFHRGVRQAGLLDDDPDIYTANVKVYMSGEGILIQPDVQTISIQFKIEIEARSWGIKDFSVRMHDTSVSVPWHSDDDTESINGVAVVDLSKVRWDQQKGSGLVTITDLNVYLDANGEVDYKHSYLEVAVL